MKEEFDTLILICGVFAVFVLVTFLGGLAIIAICSTGQKEYEETIDQDY